MGCYVFSTEALLDSLHTDAMDDLSNHDIGTDVVNMLVAQNAAHAYDFQHNVVPGEAADGQRCWAELGTLDLYFTASIDLCATHPRFVLHNDMWPIHTHIAPTPPARLTRCRDGRPGSVVGSLVSPGVVIAGGSVRGSVISPNVTIDSGALVENSVVFDAVRIGRSAVVRNAILDKFVEIGPGVEVGVDEEDDLARGFEISPGGVTVVARGRSVPR